MDERPLLSEQDPPPTATANIDSSTDHVSKASHSDSDKFHLIICLCICSIIIMLRSRFSIEPSWPIPEFQVNSLSLTNFNLSFYHSLTASWNASFEIYNPMRFEIPYHGVTSTVSYRTRMLSQARMVPFKQDYKNNVTSTLNVSISAADSYVEGRALHGIYKELKHGSVSFNVTLVVDYGYARASRFPQWPQLMVVVCEDVVVSVSMSGGSGYLIDGPAKCSGSHAVRGN
ncbi:hypothetical protein OIU76_030213 [Salix suchowensis]|nr:hypothetical protein OIU76_030213 [Salix suchowensis]KAJ6368892.1 hypothetical protein OIU78_001291 [Salix suchowensis]